MANREINEYINRKYYRWLDYACYHCNHAGISDEANDVLNEVVIALIEKDESKLIKMLHTKKGQYTELDFYILRMIKLNVYSPTSPYQNKFKHIPANSVVDYRKLNIEDCEYEETDRPAEILAQFNQVRAIFNDLCLCEKARNVFEHRFFNDRSFSEWKGPESKKELYEIYKKTVKLIRMKINKNCLI
ncbi:MAG TPA: hypothetical protein DHV48_03735 [Prolixibacteraceae bacterium]|nr:hypothetical protein [Prolixibacteraceae bacterium]